MTSQQRVSLGMRRGLCPSYRRSSRRRTLSTVLAEHSKASGLPSSAPRALGGPSHLRLSGQLFACPGAWTITGPSL